MGPEVVFHYFDDLSKMQKEQIAKLKELYREWNSQINVISRKDVDQLYINHVLHSLSIAKLLSFKESSEILDIGTGGGFPGLPLAILFPESQFTLVDSIGKKIKVVKSIADSLELKNLEAFHQRAEETKGQYDFVLSRAVAPASKLYHWTKDKIKRTSRNPIDNGFLFLKGGDLEAEMKELGKPYVEYPLSDYFAEDFFETKKLIYIPRF